MAGDERGAACGFHALDGGVAARNLVRVTPPGGGEDGEDPFALRAKYLVTYTRDGFPVNGGGCAALQHAPTMRRRVADTYHGSAHIFSRTFDFCMNLPFSGERPEGCRAAIRSSIVNPTGVAPPSVSMAVEFCF
ncbi:hypothetical protein BGLA2_550022 [Burkholderia gladioli]|nr:hypothetical protein BGLA2_550022 [Burkholderia gladioli]